ncbi:MAG TPA: hypothetical protein VF658_08625 [Pyrinomonadaceae bacterium]|jgi:hypothetical protein
MTTAIKISLIASGLFLLAGLLTGILKYQRIMTSLTHRAPHYVDIAHRAALLYSFAALVIARLLENSPLSPGVQVLAAAVPLALFAVTIAGYVAYGLRDHTNNIFNERNFTTTWFMYLLILGEVGGVGLIFAGFLYTTLKG